MAETHSLKDLGGHVSEFAEVEAGQVEPECFNFVIHRDDIGIVEHEGYVTKVSPVAIAESRLVRESEEDGWRFFAEIHTKKSRFGSHVTHLLENEDGEIYDILLDTEIEFLRPVTIESLDRDR